MNMTISMLVGMVMALVFWRSMAALCRGAATVMGRLRERYAGRRFMKAALVAAAVLSVLDAAFWFGAPVLLGALVLPMLMTLSFYTDLPQYSFAQNVADALVGKEGYPLELVAGTLNVQLFNAGIYIGDMFERLEGSQAVSVNLRGPIKKAISSGAINAPAYVKMTNAGLAAAASGEKCCGIAIFPYVAAANDMVSYIKFDCVMP